MISEAYQLPRQPIKYSQLCIMGIISTIVVHVWPITSLRKKLSLLLNIDKIDVMEISASVCVYFSDLHHNEIEELQENTFHGLMSLRFV